MARLCQTAVCNEVSLWFLFLLLLLCISPPFHLTDRKSGGCLKPSSDQTDTNVVIGIDQYECDGINTSDLHLIL